MMIKEELFNKYQILSDDFYGGEKGRLLNFLIATDYVASKIAESIYLQRQIDEDYTEVLQAREWARERINELSERSQNE